MMLDFTQHVGSLASRLRRLASASATPQAEPIPGNVGPRYPAALKAQNVEGEVLAQFVVDPTGRPRMSTFEVLRATDALFAQAVRVSVAGARCRPADIAGRKVQQLVQQPFDFRLTFRGGANAASALSAPPPTRRGAT